VRLSARPIATAAIGVQDGIGGHLGGAPTTSTTTGFKGEISNSKIWEVIVGTNLVISTKFRVSACFILILLKSACSSRLRVGLFMHVIMVKWTDRSAMLRADRRSRETTSCEYMLYSVKSYTSLSPPSVHVAKDLYVGRAERLALYELS
jgi:hypothetical protein